jgi:hypothetical protein
MKRVCFVLGGMFLFVFLFTACQPKVDIAKEKEAIMAVINQESQAALDRNPEALKALYIQDEMNTRVNLSPDTCIILKGWSELEPKLDSYKPDTTFSRIYKNIKFSKENARIKVTGNTAWVLCDNIWQGDIEGKPMKVEGLQITFLEKVNGQWKFSFAAWLSKPNKEAENEEEEEEENTD